MNPSDDDESRSPRASSDDGDVWLELEETQGQAVDAQDNLAPTERLIQGAKELFQRKEQSTTDAMSMRPDELLEGVEAQGEWAAVNNLDAFFTRMYHYYYEGGFTAILMARVANLIVLAFTISFSTFLLVMVEWRRLLRCSDEEECDTFVSFITTEALVSPSTYEVLVMAYFVLFSFYWLWSAAVFPHTVWSAWEMRQFYLNILNMPIREMQTVEWNDIVQKLVVLHQTGKYRILIRTRRSKRMPSPQVPTDHLAPFHRDMSAGSALDRLSGTRQSMLRRAGTHNSAVNLELPLIASVDETVDVDAFDDLAASGAGGHHAPDPDSSPPTATHVVRAGPHPTGPPPYDSTSDSEGSLQSPPQTEVRHPPHHRAFPSAPSQDEFGYAGLDTPVAESSDADVQIHPYSFTPRGQRPLSPEPSVSPGARPSNTSVPRQPSSGEPSRPAPIHVRSNSTSAEHRPGVHGGGHPRARRARRPWGTPPPSPTMQRLGDLSALHVACRIMRKHNFLIALINKNVLDMHMRVPFGCKLPLLGRELCIPIPFTKSLEWNLHYTVFNYMLSSQFTLRRQFLDNVSALQQRFIVFGVLNIVLMPFILLFMIIYFFMKYAEELHSKKDYLGPRMWSNFALWNFREFNELHHIFDRRVNASLDVANQYQRQFPSPVLAIIGKFVSFLAGAIVSAMLLLALVDETLLLHIQLGDRNLLWYIAILSAILAISRSLVPAPRDKVLDPDGAMKQLVSFTHYMPRSWRGRTATFDVRDEVLQLFQYRIILFAMELLSVVLVPLYMVFMLPMQATRIVEFIQSVTIHIDGIGAVCAYAAFDVQKFGNSKYGADRKTDANARPKQGKLEKSIVNFVANHPDWQPSRSAARVMGHLKAYQMQQSGIFGNELGATAPLSRAGSDYGDDLSDTSGTAPGQLRVRRGAGGLQLGPGGGWGRPTGVDAGITGSSMRRTMLASSAARHLRHSDQPLSASSLMLPLGTERYLHQENYFYWLDRFYESNDDDFAAPSRWEDLTSGLNML